MWSLKTWSARLMDWPIDLLFCLRQTPILRGQHTPGMRTMKGPIRSAFRVNLENCKCSTGGNILINRRQGVATHLDEYSMGSIDRSSRTSDIPGHNISSKLLSLLISSTRPDAGLDSVSERYRLLSGRVDVALRGPIVRPAVADSTGPLSVSKMCLSLAWEWELLDLTPWSMH